MLRSAVAFLAAKAPNAGKAAQATKAPPAPRPRKRRMVLPTPAGHIAPPCAQPTEWCPACPALGYASPNSPACPTL
eukprot:gene4309-4591_t